MNTQASSALGQKERRCLAYSTQLKTYRPSEPAQVGMDYRPLPLSNSLYRPVAYNQMLYNPSVKVKACQTRGLFVVKSKVTESAELRQTFDLTVEIADTTANPGENKVHLRLLMPFLGKIRDVKRVILASISRMKYFLKQRYCRSW